MTFGVPLNISCIAMEIFLSDLKNICSSIVFSVSLKIICVPHMIFDEVSTISDEALKIADFYVLLQHVLFWWCGQNRKCQQIALARITACFLMAHDIIAFSVFYLDQYQYFLHCRIQAWNHKSNVTTTLFKCWADAFDVGPALVKQWYFLVDIAAVQTGAWGGGVSPRLVLE